MANGKKELEIAQVGVDPDICHMLLRNKVSTPSQAKEPGAPLRSFAPLHIKITMEGGTMLDYRIVEKAPFTIVGVKRSFNSDTSYQEIPKFWDEWLAQGEKRPIMGTFGFFTLHGFCFCFIYPFKDIENVIGTLYMNIFGFHL